MKIARALMSVFFQSKLEDEVCTNEKLPSMKTAMDVVSRILWDASLPEHCFLIGYLDRHLGIIEKNFSAFSWEDVSSVDYNTLAIPKHRIQYFKYQGIKVSHYSAFLIPKHRTQSFKYQGINMPPQCILVPKHRILFFKNQGMTTIAVPKNVVVALLCTPATQNVFFSGFCAQAYMSHTVVFVLPGRCCGNPTTPALTVSALLAVN